MAINKNSNGYTLLFAFIMVVIVGTLLATASISLKPFQEKNAAIKQMMGILGAMQIEADRSNADKLFTEYITDRIILDHQGEVVSTKTGAIDATDANDAFNTDVQGQFRDRELTAEEKSFPIFIGEKDGETVYIIPMVGKGLWGPIWGFVSLKDDLNTILGATFNHAGETPGLGAEISESFFQEPFEGKKLYNEEGELVSIEVKKGGSSPDDPHAVDGITGGTITSKGVEEMIARSMQVYDNYFDKVRTQDPQASIN